MSVETKNLKIWVIVGAAIVAVLLITGLVVSSQNRAARIEDYSERFALLSDLRREALEEYFDTVRTEVTFWSLSQELLDSERLLATVWQRSEAVGLDPAEQWRRLYVTENPYPAGERLGLAHAGDSSEYSSIHAKVHELARLFVLERGYYDFFLIDLAGNILYTVEKESDFATNLLDGPWSDSGLAGVFQRARENAATGAVSFSDFAPYPPSGNAPAMFAAKALTDRTGRTQGVLAMQLPTDRIQEIMQFRAGMGESGETYLVGEDHLMRSDSRFSNESTILRTRVETDPASRALSGEQGVIIADDYRGVPVLSAYTHVDIDGIRWAVLAEIDEEEVLNEGTGQRRQMTGVLSGLFLIGLAIFGVAGMAEWGGGGLGSFDADLSDMGDG